MPQKTNKPAPLPLCCRISALRSFGIPPITDHALGNNRRPDIVASKEELFSLPPEKLPFSEPTPAAPTPANTPPAMRPADDIDRILRRRPRW